MEIDLGPEIVITIKMGNDSYELREPTVDDVEAMTKAEDGETNKALIALLIDLGLPKDVANSLGIIRLKRLSDGLMKGFESKK